MLQRDKTAVDIGNCLEAVREDIGTGECVPLKRFTGYLGRGMNLGDYAARLAESGWLHPEDAELCAEQLSRPSGGTADGKVILNGVRIKPADVYVRADFEIITRDGFRLLLIRETDRKPRTIPDKCAALIGADNAGAFYPIRLPLGGCSDAGAYRRETAEYFGLSSRDTRAERDGMTAELLRFGDDYRLMAVYEGELSLEERGAVELFGQTDAETGLRRERFLPRGAGLEGRLAAALLVETEERGSLNAAAWVVSDSCGGAFLTRDGQPAAIWTSGSPSRLDYDIGALCGRLSRTAGEFRVRYAVEPCPVTFEELLKSARSAPARPPREYGLSAAAER